MALAMVMKATALAVDAPTHQILVMAAHLAAAVAAEVAATAVVATGAAKANSPEPGFRLWQWRVGRSRGASSAWLFQSRESEVLSALA